MNILEKMLEVETQARQIVEDAKSEANAIRKKGREDAKQLVSDGRKSIHEEVQHGIFKIEQEAEERKTAIVGRMNTQLKTMEQKAGERIKYAVDHVLTTLLT